MCLGVRTTIYETMNNSLSNIPIEKTDSPCPTSHQLPINVQVGIRSRELIPDHPPRCWNTGWIDIVQILYGNQSCYEFMSHTQITPFHSRLHRPLVLLLFLHPLPWRFLSLGGRECIIYGPLMAEHSTASYSLYIHIIVIYNIYIHTTVYCMCICYMYVYMIYIHMCI